MEDFGPSVLLAPVSLSLSVLSVGTKSLNEEREQKYKPICRQYNREEVYRFSILYNVDSLSSHLLSWFLKVKEVHDWEFMVGANPFLF